MVMGSVKLVVKGSVNVEVMRTLILLRTLVV
jgi:hypothetical protein